MMKQSLADELREMLSDEDGHVVDLLIDNKQRRTAEVDHLARNTSVKVAGRTKPAGLTPWLVGALATSAAAIVVVFTQFEPAGDAGVAMVRPTTTTSQRGELQPVTAQTTAMDTKTAGPRRVQSSATVLSVDVLLEREAEQQFVDMLADAITDEATWSVSGDDVDRIIQERTDEDGI